MHNGELSGEQPKATDTFQTPTDPMHGCFLSSYTWERNSMKEHCPSKSRSQNHEFNSLRRKRATKRHVRRLGAATRSEPISTWTTIFCRRSFWEENSAVIFQSCVKLLWSRIKSNEGGLNSASLYASATFLNTVARWGNAAAGCLLWVTLWAQGLLGISRERERDGSSSAGYHADVSIFLEAPLCRNTVSQSC